MTRAHFVKKAQKDNPVAKKGESYYWWQFAYGRKQYSKNPPTRSQLTQSSFLSQLYDIQDEDLGIHVVEDIEITRDDLVSRLESLRDECQDSLDNMPEHLQDSSNAGQLLTERIEGLENWISALESVDCEIDVDTTEIDEDETLSIEEKEEKKQELIDEAIQEKISEIQDCSNEGGF